MVDSNSLQASSSVSRCRYQVFLSFRGEDTRRNFADHLYRALLNTGVHVFRDNEEIERGEDIMTKIEEALRESKIAIIVFSKDYTSSRSCLFELEIIMELRRTKALIVVPVFYGVDPSHVRKQDNSFKGACIEHEERYKEDMEKEKGSRTTFEEVSRLAGFVYENQNESKFIQEIVNEINKQLNPKALITPSYLVGMNTKVKDMNLWLQDKSNGVGIATISGIGGVGKTTMAKVVYNQNFEKFDAGSFLYVNGKWKQPNDLRTLQKQLLSNILKGKANKIYSVDEGLNRIKDALCCRRAILFFDDVNDLDQLYAIIGRLDWLCSGSKIVLTTRCERLFPDHIICEKFKVKELYQDESIQLFSWHAFGQGHPVEGYMNYCKSAAYHCCRIPLALQVLGSTLSGKSVEVWESTFQELEAIRYPKIRETLRISYDNLDDVYDRNLFLDLVCFFLGKKKEFIIRILDRCGYKTTLGIEKLIDNGLVSLDENGKLMIHQFLIDMGKDVVCEESRDDPGKRSRVWDHEEAFAVLRDCSGTETVKGLTLNMHMLMVDKHASTTDLLSSGKRGHFEDSVDNISKWHRLRLESWEWMKFLRTFSFQSSNESQLEVRAIAKMPKLQLLQINHVVLKGIYEDFPKGLRWLCWQGFPLKFIPSEVRLGNLVALDMRNSCLNYFRRGNLFLPQLKFLNLSYSYYLIRTPIFSGLPRLERLKLKNCISLDGIDETIGDLQQLLVLNLTGCIGIRKLPNRIIMLKALKELILSGCSSIKELPEHMEKMKSLRVFKMDGTPMMNQLSINFLSFLNLRKRLQYQRSLWNSLPHSLSSLSLKNCNITDIPADLSSFSSLKIFCLSGNPFRTLPESIKNLNVLKRLELEDCSRLELLPELPMMSLTRLLLKNCSSLRRAKNIRASHLGFFYLIDGCKQLFEIDSVFKLQPLSRMNREFINNLGWPYLDSLESIEVEMFCDLTQAHWKTSPQVLYECGIYSIFLPSNDVTSWLSHQVEDGCSLSFHVDPRFCGLNLYIVYASMDEIQINRPRVTIHNTTKDLRFFYYPAFHGLTSHASDCILWLSHWKCLDHLLDDGDQVDILINPDRFRVVKLGIHLIYGTKEQIVDESVSPCHKTNFTLDDLATYEWSSDPRRFSPFHDLFLPRNLWRPSADYRLCSGNLVNDVFYKYASFASEISDS